MPLPRTPGIPLPLQGGGPGRGSEAARLPMNLLAYQPFRASLTTCPTPSRHLTVPTSPLQGEVKDQADMPSATTCSQLPLLEVDAGVDEGVNDIRDEVGQKTQQRKDVERGEHHGIVAVDGRLEAKKPQPVQREDLLDEQ